MRIRALMLTPVLVAMAILGIGASAASAAKLYTTSARTTLVPVGTVATGVSGTVSLRSGTTTVNSCTSSNLTLRLMDNGGTSGNVVANVTAGTFSGCNFATTANTATNWVLTVSGSSTTGGTCGTNNVWLGSTVTSVSVTFLGGTYTGGLTSAAACGGNGVSASQTAAGTGLTLNFRDAGTLRGPLTNNGVVNAAYTLTGTAANYSLGN